MALSLSSSQRKGASIMDSKQLGNRLSRRQFLGSTGASALALSTAPSLLAADTVRPGPRASTKSVKIGVVGGGFGASFQWHLHPNCQVIAVCELRNDRLERLKKVYRCETGYKDYREFLKHSGLEAVALFTPAPFHFAMAIEAMTAGKHLISAVPAGMTEEELEKLIEVVKRTGLKYMMAETSYFRPETQTCMELSRRGRFGTIFYSEAEYHHTGSLEYYYGDGFDCQTCHLGTSEQAKKYDRGVPTWSHGYPPMLYPTHCTGMVVPVTGERLVEVVAHGWGDGHESLKKNYYNNNPFWNTVALFKTSRGHASRISIAWHIAAAGTERGLFYGDRMSYIMERPEGSPNTLITQQEKPGSRYGLYQGDIKSEAYAQPKHMEKLPEPLRIESGHGGSHTFITHEFVSAIVEDRQPAVNIWEAVAYTLPGIIAHKSALRGGELLKIKDYGTAPDA
jgi:predicted dehydrogenase